MRRSFYLSFLLLLIFTKNILAQHPMKIIAYLPSYEWASIPKLDYSKVSNINLCFAFPDPTGYLLFDQTPSDVVVAAHNRKVEVMISLGTGGAYPLIIQNYTNGFRPANRAAFVKQMVNYVKANNLDGIDLDFEADALLIPYYNDFVVALSTELHKIGKKISAAVALWTGSRYTDKALASLDWISMMCYDATGPWTASSPGQHAPMSQVYSNYSYWHGTRLLPSKKIVLGVPFYGYEFVNSNTVNSLSYEEIVAKYAGAENKDLIHGNIYYNGIPTIKIKTDYAYHNAGGIMCWQWAHDATGAKSLLGAINSKLSAMASANTVTTAITDEEQSPSLIYPNPASDSFHIDSNAAEMCVVQIYNSYGETIYSSSFEHSTEIQISSWPNGIYFVRLKTGNQVEVKKLMKY